MNVIADGAELNIIGFNVVRDPESNNIVDFRFKTKNLLIWQMEEVWKFFLDDLLIFIEKVPKGTPLFIALIKRLNELIEKYYQVRECIVLTSSGFIETVTILTDENSVELVAPTVIIEESSPSISLPPPIIQSSQLLDHDEESGLEIEQSSNLFNNSAITTETGLNIYQCEICASFFSAAIDPEEGYCFCDTCAIEWENNI